MLYIYIYVAYILVANAYIIVWIDWDIYIYNVWHETYTVVYVLYIVYYIYIYMYYGEILARNSIL